MNEIDISEQTDYEDDEDLIDNDFTVDATGHKKKKNPQKVEITIEGGHHYSESACNDKGGQEFTSVGFMAKTYGGCGGCDTEEEIQNSVKSYKGWILKEGDIPIVKDLRIEQSLGAWMGAKMEKPKFSIEEVGIYDDDVEGFQDGEPLTEYDGADEDEQEEYLDRADIDKCVPGPKSYIKNVHVKDKAQAKLREW